ncbi:MAG TPA: CHAD domain-containing protein [Gemmatimonadales bacterium]|nr:CHAD domain-containing protein [Gemmatimonadales bacterium]
MTDRVPALLGQPATAAVARIALARLDEARAACARLDDRGDPEALHDFRVAVRRLRTLVRAFSDELDNAIPKKLERRVRDLARLTTAGRDAEVQLAWLHEVGGRRGPGIAWFRTKLEDRRDRAYEEIRRSVPHTFRGLERRLRRRFNGALAEPAKRLGPFAPALARELRAESAALRQEFAIARSASDTDAVHGARIAVKRMRYLLEPVGDGDVSARSLVERLKRLQTALGELHDLQILLQEFGEAAAEAAAERVRRKHALLLRGGSSNHQADGPRPSPAGVLAIANLAARRQEAVFARDLAEWRDGALEALTGDVARWAGTRARLTGARPRLHRRVAIKRRAER